ncbi:bifunctional folylpolyglutamate synthase/dihydrofolate synthase [Haliangium sp.]|uniref:bifunctional folylpolyglutamate synthase/dihydrofolate synthase n=1 Tax=Haliangium sp. TaxID=2663208 RepID=UPI003D0FD12F
MSPPSDALARLLGRLYAARRAGIVLGLERVERCLGALGHPERRPAVRVHIGGTNGKGSTSSFVEAIARAAGCRTGLFTSPHLVRFAERIRVDGEPVSDAALVAAGEAVAAVGGTALTFFEQVTVMAAQAFASAGVDLAIFEVGLGGRLDATNAVAAEVAAVTGVALDHQAVLGDTLEAIAAEKAGIFKSGQHVVIGRAGEPEARPWLAARARAVGAAAVRVVDAPVPAQWALGLSGGHQRDNAACAMAIAEALAALGHLPADPVLWRAGLASAHIPGRLEQIAPGVILDGAHNPHAARALAVAMASLPRPRVLVLAVARDKDVAGIATPLLALTDGVVVTAFAQDRSLPAETLAERVRAEAPALPCELVPEAAAAVDRARAWAAPTGVAVVAGSLMLVGEVRAHLLGEAPDPVALGDPAHLGDPDPAGAAPRSRG